MTLATAVLMMYLIPIFGLTYLCIGMAIMQLQLQSMGIKHFLSEKESHIADISSAVWPIYLASRLLSPIVDGLSPELLESVIN